MANTSEPRVRNLIALADGAAWHIPPSDSAIASALDEAQLAGTKADLIEGLTATIQLAQRMILRIQQNV